jgi:N-acetylneuraminate synthase
MLDLRELHAKYKDRVKALGFSGHHLGIAVDIAAYAMGATWVERHFTKDRTWKGTDHAASLEPAGLEKLCRDLQAAYKCMTYKEEEILPIEKEQRAKLKWGCYNAKQVKRGSDGSPKKATSPTTNKEPKSPKSPKSPTTTKGGGSSPKKAKA